MKPIHFVPSLLLLSVFITGVGILLDKDWFRLTMLIMTVAVMALILEGIRLME